MLKRIGSLMLSVLFFISGQSCRADEWEYVLAPYGLLPSITGDASIGRVDDAEVNLDPGNVLESLEFGAMLQAEARHSSGFGASLNYAFMNLGENATGPMGLTQLESDIFQGTLEGFGTYRFNFQESTLDAYAGVRWWEINIDVDLTGPLGGRRLSRDKDWVDPVLGLRWISQLNDSWRLLLQGDIGGFDIASQFTWGLQAGAIWDVETDWSIVFLYKVLAVDYESGEKGTPDYFSYDTTTQGPLVGMIFRF